MHEQKLLSRELWKRQFGEMGHHIQKPQAGKLFYWKGPYNLQCEQKARLMLGV